MQALSQLLRAFALAGALVAPPVVAQDLLPDGDFSSANQLSGWTANFTEKVQWSSNDGESDASSGSLETTGYGTGFPTTALSSCFAVVGGQHYRIGGKSQGAAGTISGGFRCTVWNGAACSGTSALLPYLDLRWVGFTGGNWYAGQMDGLLPDDAQSATCSAIGTPKSLTVWFDDLFFESPGSGVLANGNFRKADQLAGWTCSGTGAAAEWSSDNPDAALSYSGSLQLSASTACDPETSSCTDGHATCQSTCLAANAGSSAVFSLGGKSRRVGDDPGSAATLSCTAYSDASCGAGATPLTAPIMSAETSWPAARAVTEGALPAGTHSVACAIQVSNAPGSSPFTSTYHFDEIGFFTDVVFAAEFE